MVKARGKSISARSSLGSPRAALSVKAAEHSSKNGLQDPRFAVEQPGQRTAELLEEQPQKKKWSPSENKEVMKCFYTAEPSKHGFQQRMYKLWLTKYPNTNIKEQRLADRRRVIINKNLLTQVELEELQRDPIPLGTPNLVTEENDHQLDANIMQQINDTEILMEQPHVLTLKKLELKDKLLKQMEHTIRLRLPILKDAPKRNLAQIIQDINNVLTTIRTTSIGETNNLMYNTALLVTEELGYEVKCRARIPKESPKWKIRLENKVAYMRNEISCLEHLRIGTLRSTKVRNSLRNIIWNSRL